MQKINPLMLVVPYAVIPAFFIILPLLDANTLRVSPDDFLIWALFFNLPHIISSFIVMADKDYLRTSRMKSAIPIFIIAGIALCLFLITLNNDLSKYVNYLIVLLYAIFTTHHVISQQFGISCLILKQRPRNFSIIKHLSLFVSILIYIKLFLGNEQNILNLIDVVVVVVSMILILIVVFDNTRYSSSVGRVHFYANVVMIVAIVFYSYHGWVLALLATPRFIHDISAFLIYINHDENKNKNKTSNYVYKLMPIRPMTFCIVTPSVGIVIANLLEYAFWEYLLLLYMICDFNHYYIESKIWKKGSAFRRSVAVG